MPKLLIVDDEACVREGIAQMLLQCELGELSILTAASGREGLALAEAERPEIIISDVRMPQMNGLDMARALTEKLPESKFIFISAYSEIAYYRAAMKLRAVSFVEKPIVPEELLSEVRRAIELYTAERRISSAPLSEAEQEEIAFLSLLHYSPESIPSSIQKTLQSVDSLYVFVIGRLRQIPDAGKMAALRELMRRAMEPVKALSLCGMDSRNCVVVLGCAPLTDARLQALAQSLINCFSGELPFVTAAQAEGASTIQRALEAAVSRQIQQFFYPCPCFYMPPEDGVIKSPLNICTPALIAEMSEAIERRQADRTIDLVSSQLLRLRQPAECTPEHVRLTALHLLTSASEAFARLGVKRISPVGWEDLSLLESFDALAQYVASTLRSWFDSAEALDESGRCVYLIRCEIERSYSDPNFSVALLSERIHLSESYAGNLFKRRTGMTIGTYLNVVRMERAKQLLSDPSNKVAEVGLRVGIENTDYFTRRFKQYTGKTPSEFRR